MALQDIRKATAGLYRLHVTCEDLRRGVVRHSSKETQEKLRGLTMQQYAALEKTLLLTKKRPEGVNLKEIAALIQSSPSSSSVMMESLVKRGLIERAQNPGDRRTVLIRLTEKGQKTINEAQSLMTKSLTEMVSKLTPEEAEQLISITAKLCD